MLLGCLAKVRLSRSLLCSQGLKSYLCCTSCVQLRPGLCKRFRMALQIIKEHAQAWLHVWQELEPLPETFDFLAGGTVHNGIRLNGHLFRM